MIQDERMRIGIPPFHDAHAHAIDQQVGGFLIALHGHPKLPYMLSNVDVIKQQDLSRNLIAVPYVSIETPIETKDYQIVKYHARREGYTPEWVSANLTKYPRKIALLDTLNCVDWDAKSYLNLAKHHANTQFLFCHAGGYDILEFIKMARFLTNVWIDFSATQEIFGWVGNAVQFNFVIDAMKYALSEPRISKKILFGSDNPEFKQAEAVAMYVKYFDNNEDLLRHNFERLISIAKV